MFVSMFYILETSTGIFDYKSDIRVPSKIDCNLNVQYASRFYYVIRISSERTFSCRVCSWNTGKALEEGRHD